MVLSIFFLSLLLNWCFLGIGEEKGWVRVSLPLLRTMTGPVQHFYSSILDAWRVSVFAKLSERKGAEYADLKGSLQPHTSSHLRERDKMLLRAILCGGVWNGFLAPVLWQKRRRWALVLGVYFLPPSSTLGNCLSSLHFCPWIAASGPDVCNGMCGCLDLVVLVTVTLGFLFWGFSLR